MGEGPEKQRKRWKVAALREIFTTRLREGELAGDEQPRSATLAAGSPALPMMRRERTGPRITTDRKQCAAPLGRNAGYLSPEPATRERSEGKSRAPGDIRVVHLSSTHYADDRRIFWKECISLARAGYKVSFIVPSDECGKRTGVDIVREGIEIVGVPRRPGRIGRMLVSPLEVVLAGLRRKADIYHFHDPELLPLGLLLRMLGKHVIYDVHEDVPRDILVKPWIPRGLRGLLSVSAGSLEWIGARALSGVVAATPTIARRFPKDRVALVQNFALKSEFPEDGEAPREPRWGVAYVGGLTADRCAFEMVEAIGRIERFPELRFLIAGIPESQSLMARIRELRGWSRVEYRGYQNREGVRRLLHESRVGLVLFRPLRTFLESQPVKLFEYMAAGIPVIAADFPRFREIVEGNGCGICVPSQDVAAVASAIEWIFDHPEEAEEMGRRGRQVILGTLNWEHEEHELLGLYRRVAGT